MAWRCIASPAREHYKETLFPFPLLYAKSHNTTKSHPDAFIIFPATVESSAVSVYAIPSSLLLALAPSLCEMLLTCREGVRATAVHFVAKPATLIAVASGPRVSANCEGGF